MSEQTRMPLHDDAALFVTDEELADRLLQLENGLLDLSARLPAMAREAAAIRRWLVTGRGASEPKSRGL